GMAAFAAAGSHVGPGDASAGDPSDPKNAGRHADAGMRAEPAAVAAIPGATTGASATLVYARPLLGIRRVQTEQFCADSGLTPWNDPHNRDPAFARVRVRESVMPVL